MKAFSIQQIKPGETAVIATCCNRYGKPKKEKSIIVIFTGTNHSERASCRQ